MTFKIKEHKNETENKTIRFPISSFVIQACRYALENIEETDIKKNDK